jgi:hypothetical protein
VSEPVKQHYVSKFYLKNFATNGKLFVFDKPTGTWNPEPSTPKDEARSEHVNTVFIQGSPSYMFDSFLEEIEDKAAPVVDQICRQRALPARQEARARLARFIASTQVRTPGHRGTLRQVVPMLFGNVAAELNPSETDSVAGLRKLFEEFLTPSLGEILSEEAMVTMIPGNTLYLAEIILRRKWHLILADKGGPHFVTSDNPVSGLFGQETVIPLSPMVALLASDQVEGELIQGDDRYVRVVNWMTYTNTVSSVYARKVDDRFLRDMEELGRKPELKPELAYVREALRSL